MRTLYRGLFVIMAILPGVLIESAFGQIIGDPDTCPLCNVPLKVQQLQIKHGDALEQYPVKYLTEGESGESKKTIANRDKWWVNREWEATMINGQITMVKRYTEDSVAYEPYMYTKPKVSIVDSSVPDAIVFSGAGVYETLPWQVGTPRTFFIRYQAGSPGRDAVVWLLGEATRQHISNPADVSQVYFLQPVVIKKAPVPITVQEMVVLPAMELQFFIQDQKLGESAYRLSGECPVTISHTPYDPAVNRYPHLLRRGERNCAVLVSLHALKNGTSTEVRRVLLLITDVPMEDGKLPPKSPPIEGR